MIVPTASIYKVGNQGLPNANTRIDRNINIGPDQLELLSDYFTNQPHRRQQELTADDD